MTNWVASLAKATSEGQAALVSVLATEGSAPRGPGTRMIVTADGTHGTIGGGNLEFQAIGQARAILSAKPGNWRVQDYPLGPLLGQCCGGRVRLMVEHVDPARLGWLEEASGDGQLVTRLGNGTIEREVRHEKRFVITPMSARGDKPASGDVIIERLAEGKRPLYLFGAGHVGQAVARHAGDLPLFLAWFDTRLEFGELDGVTLLADEDVEGCIADAPEEAAIAILTHDHGLDYRLTRAALFAKPTAFVGLIGSGTKRARFHSRLNKDGVTDDQRARLVCPIGVDGVSGKEPDVIAIAILAQILQLGPVDTAGDDPDLRPA